MILGHLAAIAKHPRYGKAHKFSFIEANMSYIGADLVATWCRRMCNQPMTVESRDPTPRGRVGVWTGPYEKETYAWTLRDIVESECLCFAAEMIGSNIERDKAELIGQLRRFNMERMEPKDLVFGKWKYTYGAKSAGGGKDDLAMALMIAVYWGALKREDPQFLMWARQMGYRTC